MSQDGLNILIHTEYQDLHAILVAKALADRGHQVTRSYGSDLPSRSSIAWHFGGSDQRLHWHEPGATLELPQVQVVWNRRPQSPALPTLLDPADRAYAWEQNLIAQRSLSALCDQAFWANAPEAVRAANLKPLQLRLAPDAGLNIPATLVSNEPRAIRDFLAAHPRVIHKPLNGHIWREGGREWGSYTARVQASDLPQDALLRATPAIFQEQVDKHCEVRAQFFGDSCLALRIESSRLAYGEYDWRLHQHGAATSGAIELPAEVHSACRRLMRALGIVAGAFDFIVTPEGRWIFLEVNEAGQFLFLEMWCRELPVVDACCAFLSARDPDFRYAWPKDPVRLAELEASAPFENILEQERKMREHLIQPLAAAG